MDFLFVLWRVSLTCFEEAWQHLSERSSQWKMKGRVMIRVWQQLASLEDSECQGDTLASSL